MRGKIKRFEFCGIDLWGRLVNVYRVLSLGSSMPLSKYVLSSSPIKNIVLQE